VWVRQQLADDLKRLDRFQVRAAGDVGIRVHEGILADP
jgi:hypothetical protein